MAKTWEGTGIYRKHVLRCSVSELFECWLVDFNCLDISAHHLENLFACWADPKFKLLVLRRSV